MGGGRERCNISSLSSLLSGGFSQGPTLKGLTPTQPPFFCVCDYIPAAVLCFLKPDLCVQTQTPEHYWSIPLV